LLSFGIRKSNFASLSSSLITIFFVFIFEFQLKLLSMLSLKVIIQRLNHIKDNILFLVSEFSNIFYAMF